MDNLKSVLSQLSLNEKEKIRQELLTIYLKSVFTNLPVPEQEEVILSLYAKAAETHPGIRIDFGSSVVTLPLTLADQNTLACLLRDQKVIELDGKVVTRNQVSYISAIERDQFDSYPQMERDLQRALHWYRSEGSKKFTVTPV